MPQVSEIYIRRDIRLMRSRLTGQLKFYQSSEFKSPDLQPYEVWDMDYVRTEMQAECDRESVDVIVENAYHFRTPYADYLVTDQWVPVEQTAPGKFTLIAPAIVALAYVFMKYVLPLIIFAVIVGLVGVLWIGPLTAPPEPYKGFYQSDLEGNVEGPMTYTEYITYKQNVKFPDKYCCKYCGEPFDTAEERDAHQATCPWKDKPWTQEIYPPPPEWIEALKWAIVGILAIAGVAIVVPLVTRRTT